MRPNPETTLYRSPILHVIAYRCLGHDTLGSDEEAAAENQISFPRFGVYRKRNRLGNFVVDPNDVTFFRRKEPYQVTHPAGFRRPLHANCDVSTIFEVPDRILQPMLENLPAAVKDEETFLNAAFRVPSSLKSRLFIIIKMLDNLPGGELAFEEAALDYLFDVLVVTRMGKPTAFPCCRAPRVRRDHTELVEQVRLLIGVNFSEPLPLDHLAAQVHHSPFSLSRIFKNHTGTTIHQYLLRTRLLHGLERVLDNPAGAVGQIGVESGFYSPSHFATAFLNSFGASPSDFRKQASSPAFRNPSNFLKA